MKDFRTLELAIEFYEASQTLVLPDHLREQFDRASASISLNLAEGNAKFSFKDKARIYQIAYGSLRECQIILRLGKVQDERVLKLSKHLASSVYRLIQGTIAKSDETKGSGKLNS